MNDNSIDPAASSGENLHADPGPDPQPTQGLNPTADPRLDPILLAEGDERNVVDEFRLWTVEAIAEELDRRARQRTQIRGVELQIAVENWSHDFNIGSVVRTANAFGVRHVHIVGRRRWNRRGAMVTDRYLHVHHHVDVADLAHWARSADLALLGIDNVPGSVPLERATLPGAALLVFGQESDGLSEESQHAVERIFHITQHGSTRSMNAGAAAAVAMYHWTLQHNS